MNEAIELCVKAVEACPTYASARVVLGRAYLESGDHAKAEEEFRRAVQVSPENLRARLFLALICDAQGRTNEAIGHYRAALFLAPFDRDLQARLGTLEHSGARPGPQNESSPFVTETLADLYASQGVADRAAAIYRLLLEQDPSRGDIRRKLTAALEHRGGSEQVADGTPRWRE